MAKTIAIAGKGGTGKTTIAGLVIRWLKEHKTSPVLAVDADPNTNLNQVLGVEVAKTVGALREETLKKIDKIPAGVSKDSYLEYRIQELLVEASGFDLLAMGRQEGLGCYCSVNNMLRRYIDGLAGSYKYMVVDNEAGMEHLSRRTTKEIDFLLMVADPSPRGIETAARLRDLAKELELRVGEEVLIINRTPGGKLHSVLEKKVNEPELKLGAVIPEDKELAENDIQGKSIFELDEASVAFKELGKLMEQLLKVEGG